MPEPISLQKTRLATLLPPSVLDDPPVASFELVRAVLARSNYIPGVRHRLGWCGIHEVATPGVRHGSVTARLNNRPGIYGLLPLDPGQGNAIPEPENGARFSLSYFPAPDEDILESFSIQAGIRAMVPEFMETVREFCFHPDLIDLFHIGSIETHVDESGLFLTLIANDRLGWNSQKGIRVRTPQGPVQAVEPGGIDQDIPAREIAMDFFRSLAASLSYTLAASPTLFCSQQRTAKPPSPCFLKSCEHRLSLGYFSRTPRISGDDWKNEPEDIFWDPFQPLPKGFEDEQWWDSNPTGTVNRIDKKALDITNKPRFILLTGFLGAGKTSFLDKFIQAQTGGHHFVAVVQNEIGQKSLDARLLDENYAVTQMDEGCVCCSLAGNLRSALSDIMDRFQPDFIVLETTGLANPANLLREIDDLNDILEFASITTLVDSLAGENALERFEVARDQVRLADVILMNKCDLCSPAALACLKKQIQKLNPCADIHEACNGDINPALLYGVNFRNPPKRPVFTAMGNGKNATHKKDAIETRLFEFKAPLDRESLEKTILSGGEKILRVKGIIEFSGQTGPSVFQYSPGIFRVSPLMTQDTKERFLVFIGQELDNIFKTGIPAKTFANEWRQAK